MTNAMLHIFRNSPLGRENLMQSAYFCQKHFGLSLEVYVPKTSEFTLNLKSAPYPIRLDASYTQYAHSAEDHVKAILKEAGGSYSTVIPNEIGSGAVPHLAGSWSLMACPRVITEHSNRIGLGHIGPQVRGLVKLAPFPVFIPCLAYKAWTSVTAFFGGSALGAVAVKEALSIARLSRVSVTVHTQLDGTSREECEQALAEAGILSAMSGQDVTWRIHDTGCLEENLYNVPHDSLVVVGAAGHNIIKELIFGSKLEAIQSTLPNALVVVGPECETPWDGFAAPKSP